MRRIAKPGLGLLGSVLLLAIAGCASSGTGSVNTDTDTLYSKASWYHDSLHGNPTASGEPYDRGAMTAAHRSLPFGTQVRVESLENGRAVEVRINDRGPFVDGRIIDLSRRAAENLDMIQAGVVEVRVVVLD